MGLLPPEPSEGAPAQHWVYNDGGRAEAGFQGRAGDCFTRAVAIASQRPYREVYDLVNRVAKEMRARRSSAERRSLLRRGSLRPRKRKGRQASLGNARDGVRNPLFHEVMKRLGWTWVATMRPGQGCKVHLTALELPEGRLVVRVTKHIVAVIDGVIHDTYDPSRRGSRCVYGYFQQGLGPRDCGAKTGSPGRVDASKVAAVSMLASEMAELAGAEASRPWVQTPSTPKRERFCPPEWPLSSPRPGGPVAKRFVTQQQLIQSSEAIRGFSDDDSDCEVRRRCTRRRALAVARNG